ncbi:hypothetical protein KC320_g191 [Hortaea werneckii]|nr:hypothetical protein KC320_g191 [Hortaea werneckii]
MAIPGNLASWPRWGKIEVEDILQPLDGRRGLNCLTLSAIFSSTCVRVRAPLIPEVALVELPPMKSGMPSANNHRETLHMLREQLTVLIQQHDIAAGKVNGVSSTQAGHCVPVSSSSQSPRSSGAELTASAYYNDPRRHDGYLENRMEWRIELALEIRPRTRERAATVGLCRVTLAFDLGSPEMPRPRVTPSM